MGRCIVCLFTMCSTGSICVLIGPEACTRTDAAMTLHLYVTVVRCSQTGWIETTKLKKSLGSDGRGGGLARNPPASTSLQALMLFLVLLLLVVVVVVEVTVV